jgi:hypothetical protein
MHYNYSHIIIFSRVDEMIRNVESFEGKTHIHQVYIHLYNLRKHVYYNILIHTCYKLFVYFQNISTVTLEVTDGILRTSLDNFICQILWENTLKDSRGNSAEIIRIKVSIKYMTIQYNTLKSYIIIPDSLQSILHYFIGNTFNILLFLI